MKVVGASICAVRVYCCWVSEYQTLPELDASANAVASAPQAITDLPIDIAPDIAPDALPGAVTITLPSLPSVLPAQRVSLLVGDLELSAPIPLCFRPGGCTQATTFAPALTALTAC